MKARLTAHLFEEQNGSIATIVFSTKAKEIVEVSSLAELDVAIQAFGALHTPCNVWVGAVDKKIRGFDKWNSSATKNLFRAEAPRTV